MISYRLNNSTKEWTVVGLSWLLMLVVFQFSIAAAETQTRQQTGATNSSRQYRKISEPFNCGSQNDLTDRVDFCARPLMDILSGDLEVWPRNEEDAMRLCESFGGSEKCIKDVSRRCGKGIERTIISTIGTSIQRVRKRECSRSKSADVVRTTQCIEKNQDLVKKWMGSVNARMAALETPQQPANKKINSICCMMGDIETELKSLLEPYCPNEIKLMQRIFRGIIDNALELICRQPKCNDYMKGVKVEQSDNFKGLIATVLRIVFSLDIAE